jgi:hypothetical protein
MQIRTQKNAYAVNLSAKKSKVIFGSNVASDKSIKSCCSIMLVSIGADLGEDGGTATPQRFEGGTDI